MNIPEAILHIRNAQYRNNQAYGEYAICPGCAVRRAKSIAAQRERARVIEEVKTLFADRPRILNRIMVITGVVLEPSPRPTTSSIRWETAARNIISEWNTIGNTNTYQVRR